MATLQVIFLYMLQFLTLGVVLADLRDVFKINGIVRAAIKIIYSWKVLRYVHFRCAVLPRIGCSGLGYDLPLIVIVPTRIGVPG